MRILTIANEKGGSAKTTTAVCVAGALVERGRRVLLVDLDPQGGATTWLGHGLRDQLGDVFTDRDPLEPEPTDAGIDLVVGDDRLAAADRVLERGAELQLRRAVQDLDEDRWDAVIIDTPPHLGVLAIAGVVAAQHVVVPVASATLDLGGVVRVTRRVEELATRYATEVDIAAYVPCRVKTGTGLGADAVEALIDRFGEKVTPPVRDTVKLAEAPGFRRPITQYAPTHPAADDYRAVTDAIVKLTGGR